MSIEPIVFINRGGKPKTSSVKGGNWLLSCDQHVGSCFKEENFEDGKLSKYQMHWYHHRHERCRQDTEKITRVSHPPCIITMICVVISRSSVLHCYA